MPNQPQRNPSHPPNGLSGAGCFGVLLIIVGVVLLLPGLCTLVVASVAGSSLAVLALALSAGAIWLIVIGVRMVSGK